MNTDKPFSGPDFVLLPNGWRGGASRFDDMKEDRPTAAFMGTVYFWTALGVATTTWVASFVGGTLGLFLLSGGSSSVAIILLFFGSALLVRFVRKGILLPALTFAGFSVIQGVLLSGIALEASSNPEVLNQVILAMGSGAAVLGGMSLWGWTTKSNLQPLSSSLFAALWGILGALVINIFLGSGILSFLTSAAAVVLFSALVAFDVQRAKQSKERGFGSALNHAMDLSLDFWNLALHLFTLLRGSK